jgi:hypothetical protein
MMEFSFTIQILFYFIFSALIVIVAHDSLHKAMSVLTKILRVALEGEHSAAFVHQAFNLARLT